MSNQDVESNLQSKGYVHPKNYITSNSYSPYMAYNTKEYVSMTHDPYATFEEKVEYGENEDDHKVNILTCSVCQSEKKFTQRCNCIKPCSCKVYGICKNGHKWDINNVVLEKFN